MSYDSSICCPPVFQVGQSKAAWAEYAAANPRDTSWIKEYFLQALAKYGESQQNYKLVKADIENGEIIVLLYLNNEWKNLQELPEAMSKNTADELKKQLIAMAPLLQVQSISLILLVFCVLFFMKRKFSRKEMELVKR